ncbi:uncharacterized protein B0T23DRAFT_436801 [Neurospora hispaniola]|uniref:Uncharacterized protein n=1 Tax=Neurospora hispaniola TaxID=588809 RepID=A0AAJ0HYI0_9PEZI|nr:hypothetical protein B0T23DRAFT_436801 [Neurospora hispaniola]
MQRVRCRGHSGDCGDGKDKKPVFFTFHDHSGFFKEEVLSPPSGDNCAASAPLEISFPNDDSFAMKAIFYALALPGQFMSTPNSVLVGRLTIMLTQIPRQSCRSNNYGNSYPGQQGNFRHQKKTSTYHSSSSSGAASNTQPQTTAAHAWQTTCYVGNLTPYTTQNDLVPAEPVGGTAALKPSHLPATAPRWGFGTPPSCFHNGLLAALRSRKLNSQTIGGWELWSPLATTPPLAMVPRSSRDLRGEMLEEEGRREG